MSATDLELTEKGIEQAKRVSVHLQDVMSSENVHAFCSTLKRTYQTAEYCLRELACENVDIVPLEELREMNLGELEGLTWDERDSRYPEIKIDSGLSFVETPGGEGFAVVKARCEKFVEQNLMKLPDSSVVFVFSHGITLRVLTNVLLNRPNQDVNRLNWMENTAVTEIEYESKSRIGKMLRFNDFTHLGELGTKDYCNWGFFSKEPYELL